MSTKLESFATSRITMRDIARQAGVAVTTVSSALHNTGRVSPDLKQRIADIADSMGYRPKLAARLLRASKTGRLALILLVGKDRGPTVTSQSGAYGPIIAEFVSACSRMKVGFEIEYLETGGPHIAPACFTGGQADGALLCGQVQSPQLRQWLDEHDEQYPCVHLNHQGRYNVWNNGEEGIYQAVQYLAAMGHRCLGYLGADSPYHIPALHAFQRAIKDFKLDTGQDRWIKCISRSQVHDRASWIDSQLSNARQLVADADRPTAVIAQGVPDARCLVYAAMEQGLLIPRDISVVTYGTSSDAMKAPPLLHCIEPDSAQLVQAAVGMLRARLAGETLAQESVMIMPRLIERQSALPYPSRSTSA